MHGMVRMGYWYTWGGVLHRGLLQGLGDQHCMGLGVLRGGVCVICVGGVAQGVRFKIFLKLYSHIAGTFR